MTQEFISTPATDAAAVAVDTPPAVGPSLAARLGSEALGTFMLVFFGVGAALLSSSLGYGQLGVGLAFAVAVIAAASAVGHVSGGHFNPAVTFGLALAGRVSWRDVLPYWVVQAVGGIIATLVLFVALPTKFNVVEGISSSTRDELFKGAANGFGTHGPSYSGAAQTMVDGYLQSGATNEQIVEAVKSGQVTLPDSINFTWGAALLLEIIATAIFVGVILAVTDKRSTIKFQPVVIGLTLGTLVSVLMPVTNGSLNPARSLAAAVFAGGWTWGQLWVFVVAPLVGGAIAALFYRGFAAPRVEPVLVGTATVGEFFVDASEQPFTVAEPGLGNENEVVPDVVATEAEAPVEVVEVVETTEASVVDDADAAVDLVKDSDEDAPKQD